MSDDDHIEEIPSPVLETFDVNDIALHSGHEVFADPDPVEIDQLADSIRREGLHHPLEVTPDGVLLAGRKRLAAVKLLDWTEVDCWVRYDLEDDGAAESFLLADNLIRHSLLPCERARAMQRYIELTRGSLLVHHGELRDWIGKQFNVTGRTLSRHLALLKTPRPVQDAVDRRDLGLVQANKVAGLPPEQQEAFAAALAAGEPAKQLLEHYCPPKRKPKARAAKAPTGDSLLYGIAMKVGELVRVAQSGDLARSDANAAMLDGVIASLQRLRAVAN